MQLSSSVQLQDLCYRWIAAWNLAAVVNRQTGRVPDIRERMTGSSARFIRRRQRPRQILFRDQSACVEFQFFHLQPTARIRRADPCINLVVETRGEDEF